MQYHDWLLLFRLDAQSEPSLILAGLPKATFDRLRNISPQALEYICSQDVEPTVNAVLEWCAVDPERLADRDYWLRERGPLTQTIRERSAVAA